MRLIPLLTVLAFFTSSVMLAFVAEGATLTELNDGYYKGVTPSGAPCVVSIEHREWNMANNGGSDPYVAVEIQGPGQDHSGSRTMIIEPRDTVVPKSSGCGSSPKVEGNKITYMLRTHAETTSFESAVLTFDESLKKLKKLEMKRGGESFIDTIACLKFPDHSKALECGQLQPAKRPPPPCNYDKPSARILTLKGKSYCASYMFCGGYKDVAICPAAKNSCPLPQECWDQSNLTMAGLTTREEISQAICVERSGYDVPNCHAQGNAVFGAGAEEKKSGEAGSESAGE